MVFFHFPSLPINNDIGFIMPTAVVIILLLHKE